MKRIDIMFDLETLGISAKAQLIQISAVAFDIETGATGNVPYNATISVPENATIDGSTLGWWLRTNPELLAKIINSGAVSEKDALAGFADWLKACATLGEVFLWGNGILFDNRIVKEKMDHYGIVYPINYHNDRDVRTLVDLYTAASGECEDTMKQRFNQGTAHNAADDVAFQIVYTVFCYNYLKGRR